MPKTIQEEVGKIIRTRTVKTKWDQVKEFLQGLAGAAIIITVLVLIFT